MKLEELENKLFEERMDIESELISKLTILSLAKYDSKTLKLEIDVLLRSLYELEEDELDILKEKERYKNGTR